MGKIRASTQIMDGTLTVPILATDVIDLIDAAGGTPTGASVFLNTTPQTLTSGTEAAISFNAEHFDDDNLWVVGQPTRLTIAEDGQYFVNAQIRLDPNYAGSVYVRLYKNGTRVAGSSGVGSDNARNEEHGVQWLGDLVATDFLEVKVRLEIAAGGTWDVSADTAGTFFQIFKVGGAGGGGGSGAVVQVKNVQTGAVATGNTVIPFDDTIPQSTEGDEYLTLAITPTDAANLLLIEVVVFVTVTTTPWIIVALFKDAGSDAIAVTTTFINLSTSGASIILKHKMVSGGVAATTFKVRIGPSGAATITLNGQSGGRIFGGVAASSMTVSEVVP